MTIEEAIERLENHAQYFVRADDLQAFDMVLDALRVLAEDEKNEPLTLEELREMDGEPVWVEPIHSKYREARWGIVHLCPPPELAELQIIRVLDGVTWFEQMVPYPKQKRNQMYGKTWLAYRRKPKEAAP